jgi:hypothetical protein
MLTSVSLTDDEDYMIASFVALLRSSRKCQESTLSYNTAAFFHVPLNLLFINHSIILNYII